MSLRDDDGAEALRIALRTSLDRTRIVATALGSRPPRDLREDPRPDDKIAVTSHFGGDSLNDTLRSKVVALSVCISKDPRLAPPTANSIRGSKLNPLVALMLQLSMAALIAASNGVQAEENVDLALISTTPLACGDLLDILNWPRTPVAVELHSNSSLDPFPDLSVMEMRHISHAHIALAGCTFAVASRSYHF